MTDLLVFCILGRIKGACFRNGPVQVPQYADEYMATITKYKTGSEKARYTADIRIRKGAKYTPRIAKLRENTFSSRVDYYPKLATAFFVFFTASTGTKVITRGCLLNGNRTRFINNGG